MPEYASALEASAPDTQVLGLLVNKIGSADWNHWQIQRYCYYDFVRVPNAAASTTSLSFFSAPQGQIDPNAATVQKTIEQTNMVKANTFGQVYFIVQQIRTYLAPVNKSRQNATVAARADFSFDQLVISEKLRQAYATGVLNFTIGQKGYFDIVQPWRNAPPGFGVGSNTVVVPFDRTASSAGNAHVEQSNNLSDVYALTPPQLIEPEQQFQITIDFPDLGVNFSAAYVAAAQNANVEAGVILDGYIARPVQ